MALSTDNGSIDVVILDDSLKTIESIQKSIGQTAQLDILYAGVNVRNAIINLNQKDEANAALIQSGKSNYTSRFLSIDMQFFSLEEFVSIVSSIKRGTCFVFCDESQYSSLTSQITLLEIILNGGGQENIDFHIFTLKGAFSSQFEAKSREILNLLKSEMRKLPQQAKDQQKEVNKQNMIKDLQKSGGNSSSSSKIDYSEWAANQVEE